MVFHTNTKLDLSLIIFKCSNLIMHVYLSVLVMAPKMTHVSGIKCGNTQGRIWLHNISGAKPKFQRK